MRDAERLGQIAHDFGPEVARKKQRLLQRLLEAPRLRRADQRLLAEVLDFLRAYPDSAALHRAVRALTGRLPAGETIYEYSYGVLLQLRVLFPGRLTIDWEQLPDEAPVIEALEVLLSAGERQALEAGELGLTGWFELARPSPEITDLELFLELFERSALPPQARVLLFERCELPVVYAGPPASALGLPVERLHYRRRPLDRSRFPLPPKIREPLGKPRRGGQREIDLALQALCVRSLEIHSLIYPNPAEVHLFDCGRGLTVLLVGTHPAWRSPWEVLTFFAILQNGVPVAYGPTGIFAGCCDMGINLFPAFRGGEIRNIFAQLMRVLHHHLGVEYFFLDRYGMGVDNPDAIASGAFWFYRKLGFLPTEPAIADLARSEEARMQREPGYRCDRRMLRRLSHTEVYLDLSGGRCRPLDVSLLGAAETRLVARRFRGDRAAARRATARAVGRRLGLGAASPALSVLAPVLSLLPGLGDWPGVERRRLLRFLEAKAGAREAEAARLSARMPRLLAGLRGIAAAELEARGEDPAAY